MVETYRRRGRSPQDVVQGVLGCSPAAAEGVVRRIATMLDDREVRAFIALYGEVNGVRLDTLTGETALIHCGKRELAMFLLRCHGRLLDSPDILSPGGHDDAP